MEEEVAEEGEGEEGEGEEGGVDGVEAELVPLEQDQGEATTTTTMAGGKNLFPSSSFISSDFGGLLAGLCQGCQNRQ